jgi:hypothetical protein
VFERVLEQGLQQHRGDRRVERVVGDVPVESDASREALQHDCRVEPQQVELLAQRSHVLRAGVQARAQEIGELCQQAIGARDVDLHQR